MAKKGSLGSILIGLPWIVKVLLAIFADFIFGIARFIDGIARKDVLKVIIGFLWIFYGLGIGWVLDIICTVCNIKPLWL